MLPHYNSAAVVNHNANICYTEYLVCHSCEKAGQPQGGRDPQVEPSFLPETFAV